MVSGAPGCADRQLDVPSALLPGLLTGEGRLLPLGLWNCQDSRSQTFPEMATLFCAVNLCRPCGGRAGGEHADRTGTAGAQLLRTGSWASCGAGLPQSRSQSPARVLQRAHPSANWPCPPQIPSTPHLSAPVRHGLQSNSPVCRSKRSVGGLAPCLMRAPRSLRLSVA